MNHLKRLDDEIFELLDQEEVENDLTKCLVRNDVELIQKYLN